MTFWSGMLSGVGTLLGKYFASGTSEAVDELQAEEFKTAKATEGDSIPVLFGTKNITSPNVAWYGDIKTVAIRKEG